METFIENNSNKKKSFFTVFKIHTMILEMIYTQRHEQKPCLKHRVLKLEQPMFMGILYISCGTYVSVRVCYLKSIVLKVHIKYHLVLHSFSFYCIKNSVLQQPSLLPPLVRIVHLQ